MENFLVVEKNDIIIGTVNLVRATSEEAEEFKTLLFNQINKGNCKFIVDLNQCAFIDSTFLSTLIIILKAVLKNGGNVRLVSLQEDVEEILEATGMKKVFDVHPNVSDALQSFELK